MEKILKKLHISTERSFYRDLFALAIPLALQSLFMQGVNTVDSIMLGQLGETQLSAVTIGLEPFNIVAGIVRGLSLGGALLIAQYWGKEDRDSIKKVMAISTKAGVLIGLVCLALVEIFPTQVLRVFTRDQAVITASAGYLKIIAFTFVLYAFSNNYMLAVRSMQSGRVPFITNVISYSANIFFDYAFIFGKFGFPKLGIIGVALGTLFARIIEFGICVIHMLRINDKVDFRIRDFALWDKGLFRDFMTYGIPSLLSETVFNLGMAANSAIMGNLGTTAISAKAISEALNRLPQMMITGLSGSSAVLIGKTIGEGKIDKLRERVNAYIALVGVAVVLLMLFIWGFRSIFIGFYNITEETARVTFAMTNMAILTAIGRGYEALFVTGVQVGSGDTKYIFWYTTIVSWLFVIPAAYLGAFYFHLSAPLVYFILKMDFVIKGVVGFIRTRGTKWIKDVTSAGREQTAEEQS